MSLINVEKIIKEKLFPSLFDVSDGFVPYDSDDLDFCYKKAIATLGGDSSGGFDISDKVSLSGVSSSYEMGFLRNIFKLDKFVDELCPGYYNLAREVVKNFILQDDYSSDFGVPRVRTLRAFAAAMDIENPLISNDAQLENAIFFSNLLYKNQNSEIKIDKNTVLNYGNLSALNSWFFYNFLKTGNSDEAMKSLHTQIIKGCSKNPSQINEYIDLVQNQCLGAISENDAEKFYRKLPEAVKSPDNIDSSQVRENFLSVLSVRSVTGKYQEMLCELMRDNNMFFSLDDAQKKESARCIIDMFSKGIHLLDTLHQVVEKANLFSLDLESHFNDKSFNLAVKTFKLSDRQISNAVDGLRTMDSDAIEGMTKDWHLLNARNSHLPLAWYEAAYAERHSNEQSDFYDAAKESFLKQVSADLSHSFVVNQENRDRVEVRLAYKLENFIDWIDDDLQFAILAKSVTGNSTIEPPIRQFFKEHYHKEYCDFLYDVQEGQKKQEEKIQGFPKLSYDVPCEWRGETRLVSINDSNIFMGIQNIEIENLKIQNVIDGVLAKSQNSDESSDDFNSAGFKL